MCIGIFSFRAFDLRLARLAAPISSGVRQGGRICPPPPAGRVRLNTPAGRGLRGSVAGWSGAHGPTATLLTSWKRASWPFCSDLDPRGRSAERTGQANPFALRTQHEHEVVPRIMGRVGHSLRSIVLGDSGAPLPSSSANLFTKDSRRPQCSGRVLRLVWSDDHPDTLGECFLGIRLCFLRKMSPPHSQNCLDTPLLHHS